ncbi:MAG: TPM domain-containing protein [Selenomonadaceae bacterium]|nr:TPM domain-containing protein [Selenomonadaceae bacterium]
MKKFLSLIALILLISFSVASAAKIESVTDNAGLLKPTEIELLNQRIHNIEQAHKIKIGVAFVKNVRGDMVTASNDFLDKNFANGMNGGIVLLVDMKNHKYEMSTDRRMVERITDYDGIAFLKDKFQSDLSAGNYYSAVNNFVDGVDELLTYYETKGVAYGQRAPGEIDPIAAAVAVVTAIDNLQKNTVKLNEARDTFLFMNVQRRPKSSGGGRRGGGGHGGGGHGGGGGSF